MTNQLVHEKSPYLRQHAHNPVDWRPWNHEAFELAAHMQKPIFLSIGYATCHWCHVMEGDSFEDPQVAKLINTNFVAIKVDREERPDIDQIYMNAVQALTGRGGWPLTAILSPDGKPFWGGTFLAKEQLQQLLQQVTQLWNSAEREKVIASAENIHKALAENSPRESVELGAYQELFVAQCRNRFDEAYGGFSVAPKFPPAMTLMTLMRLKLSGEFQPEVRHMVEKTLESMAMSGLCDQLGGGFHRYATDRVWKVPHFEKMLYDNALLSMAYLDAGVKYKRDDFLDVAYKTLNYILNDLRDSNGGFYSGEDADSERSEGKFYLWTKAELEKALTLDEFNWLTKHFEISDTGNFHIDPQVEALEHAAGYVPLPHGVNILHPLPNQKRTELANPKATSIFAKLKSLRDQRVRPFRDEKILAGWNGLVIAALAQAYAVSQNEKFLTAAQHAASFLSQHFKAETFLYRRWCEGETRHRGVLEDYAFFIYGLCELYQADFDETWLTTALQLQNLQDGLFWSSEEGLFFDHDGSDKTLIHRPNDFFDNATPSGNSMSLLNLKRFYLLTGNEKYRTKGDLIAKNGAQALLSYPHGLAFFCMSMDYFLNESFLLVADTTSQGFAELLACTRRAHLYPALMLAKFNTTSAFVPLKKEPQVKTRGDVFQLCSEKGCQLPTQSIDAALKPLTR